MIGWITMARILKEAIWTCEFTWNRKRKEKLPSRNRSIWLRVGTYSLCISCVCQNDFEQWERIHNVLFRYCEICYAVQPNPLEMEKWQIPSCLKCAISCLRKWKTNGEKMKIKSISSVVIFNEYVFLLCICLCFFISFRHPPSNGRYNRVVFCFPNSTFLCVFLFLNPFRHKKITHNVLFYAVAISISSRLPITQ